MPIWIIFAIYVLMSATGLFLIKTGTETTSIVIENSIFNFQLSIRLIVGFIVYIFSFILSIYVISKMKLTVFYPTVTGTMLVLTSLLGYFFLKEHIGIMQLIGMALIMVGVIVLNVQPSAL